MTDQVFDIDAAFDNAGGGSGSPSYAFPKQDDPRNANRKIPVIGGGVVGTITDIYQTVVKDPDKDNEPKLDKRGRQQPQFNITLQTEFRNWDRCVNVPTAEDGVTPLPADQDTGERRIYVKHKMIEAVAKAIKASEQGKGGPQIGAKLGVKVSDLTYHADKMRHPLPDYEAQYRPPVDTGFDAAFDSAGADVPPVAPVQAVTRAPVDTEPPF